MTTMHADQVRMANATVTSQDACPGTSVRVFLVDDHAIVRSAIAELLEPAEGIEVVGEAGSAAEALPRAMECRPDVAVLDVRLGDGSGIDVCRDIRAALPNTRCLMLTSSDDPKIAAAAMAAGAAGYLLKEVRTAGLLDAIRQVAAGRSLGLLDPTTRTAAASEDRAAVECRLAGLSPRELTVLDLLSEGLSNRQIGQALGLAEKTVKNYVSAVLAALSVHGRTEAAVLVINSRPSH